MAFHWARQSPSGGSAAGHPMPAGHERDQAAHRSSQGTGLQLMKTPPLAPRAYRHALCARRQRVHRLRAGTSTRGVLDVLRGGRAPQRYAALGSTWRLASPTVSPSRPATRPSATRPRRSTEPPEPPGAAPGWRTFAAPVESSTAPALDPRRGGHDGVLAKYAQSTTSRSFC